MPHHDDSDDRPRHRPRRDDASEGDGHPRRRPSGGEFEATELIVPTGVSAYSIIACYAGLVGMCLPILGAPFALTAFVCAIVALRKRKSGSPASYGKVTSDIRAIVGLVFSTIGLLINGGFLLILLFGK
jgi:hypothetical protein